MLALIHNQGKLTAGPLADIRACCPLANHLLICDILRGHCYEASFQECAVVEFVCVAGVCGFIVGADTAGSSTKDACQSAATSTCEGGGETCCPGGAAIEVRKVQTGERAGSDLL